MDARAFAIDAYYGRREMEHPEEVASLVRAAGGSEELCAAALLHDLVEDTDVGPDDIAREFGTRVAAYVSAMTEDESISDYGERKAEHRDRARDAGREVALLFVADKLSNARRMQRGQKKPEERKIEHYRLTEATMREAYPDLPLLDELRAEIPRTEQALRAAGPG